VQHRKEEPAWRKKLLVNGVGFGLTVFILVSLTVVKFHEGGWVTLLVTGVLVGLAFLIKRHYENTRNLLRRLDELVAVADAPVAGESPIPSKPFDPQARTAVILVNGFNGLGLHTLFGVIRLFGTLYRNFVFVQVGVVDAGNFKGASELAHLAGHVKQEANRYVEYMNRRGFHAEAFTARGIDVVEEIAAVAPQVVAKYPNAVFFGGQLVFPQETFLTRWLHNFAVFAVQRQFYYQGYPFLILPIRV
jgi:K+ transporter